MLKGKVLQHKQFIRSHGRYNEKIRLKIITVDPFDNSSISILSLI